MDVWIQRIFSIGYVAIALALIFCMVSGQDGKIFGIVAGMITGIAIGLGISNASVVVTNHL